jgi:uncharacterized membrane protein
MTEPTLLPRSPALVRAELTIAYVLRYGVLLCGGILAVGLALLLLRGGAGPGSGVGLQAQLRGGDTAALARTAPRSAAALAAGLRSLNPHAIMGLGLVLLILLPIARVGLTVVLFALERDRVYLVVTLVVFVVLVTGIVLGKTL